MLLPQTSDRFDDLRRTSLASPSRSGDRCGKQSQCIPTVLPTLLAAAVWSRLHGPNQYQDEERLMMIPIRRRTIVASHKLIACWSVTFSAPCNRPHTNASTISFVCRTMTTSVIPVTAFQGDSKHDYTPRNIYWCGNALLILPIVAHTQSTPYKSATSSGMQWWQKDIHWKIDQLTVPFITIAVLGTSHGDTGLVFLPPRDILYLFSLSCNL